MSDDLGSCWIVAWAGVPESWSTPAFNPGQATYSSEREAEAHRAEIVAKYGTAAVVYELLYTEGIA